MTLEEFKENDQLGITTDTAVIKAVMKQFCHMPVSELYCPEVRISQLTGKHLLDDLLESAGIPEHKASEYDYSCLAELIYKIIRESNPTENYAHPGYTEVSAIMENLVLLPCRFSPRYRKRKGT